MALRIWISSLAIVAVAAAPAFAQDNRHRRPRDERGQSQQAQRPARQPAPQARERAVPRTEPRREDQGRRQDQVRRDEQVRRNNESRPQYDSRRGYDARPQYDARRYDGGRYNSRGYAPRIVRPSVILIAPYRPYVYRPSYSIGVYYGSGGYYPYGYTPRGYYDPIPGRFYGGVRITGAPRDARVFADGYYVGIVDDFDGIFQHMNLEAGPHHIEIEEPGLPPIAFDVNVRPGETVTFRADNDYFRPY